MVKTRQKNFRAFIFVEGETDETIAYIAKNLELLKSLLLVFAYPLRERVPLLEYLSAEGLHFVQANSVENLGLESSVIKESHNFANINATQTHDSISPAQVPNKIDSAPNIESKSVSKSSILRPSKASSLLCDSSSVFFCFSLLIFN